jgi:hypothetical protein
VAYRRKEAAVLAWSPFSRPLGELLAADLNGLLTPEPVPEGLFLEYKRDWVPRGVGRAVASFANSEQGGTLVVGVDANKLVPKAIVGVPDKGHLEEAVNSVIRSTIAPVPRYAAKVVPLSGGQSCVVIEVPPGYEPPYIFIPTGQVLIRTATSSEPISIQDRDALDRLYQRGRRGREWAQSRISRFEAGIIGDSRRATVLAVPHVDGGLSVGRIVFTEAATTELRRRFRNPLVFEVPQGFEQHGEEIQPSADAVTLLSGEVADERWFTTTWVDGVIRSAEEPTPQQEVFPPSRLPDTADKLVPRIVNYYREVLRFDGTVTFAFFMESTRGFLRVVLDPVTIATTDLQGLLELARRALERSAGKYAWEPPDVSDP